MSMYKDELDNNIQYNLSSRCYTAKYNGIVLGEYPRYHMAVTKLKEYIALSKKYRLEEN